MAAFTKRQKQIYDFICLFFTKHNFAPTVREMAKHFRISAATIQEHKEKLVEKGLLNKNSDAPRDIELNGGVAMVKIPLLGTIAAGQPITLFDVSRETIAVPKNKIPSASEVYALRVVGNSMIDEHINDGDIILVKQQATAENGQKVVALIDNHEATLKKYYREHGHIRLQPANKNMEPIILRKDRDIKIQGVVLDVVREESSPAVKFLAQKEIEKRRDLPLNEIICGNAVDVMRTFPSSSIDLVVTSPPYDELRNYNGYNFDFEGIARGLFRVIKRGGVLVWVVGDKIKKGNKSLTSFRQALFFQELGFNAHDVMIYKKRNTPFMRSNGYTNCFEFMLVFSKGSPQKFNPLKVKTVRQGNEMLTHNKGPDGINKKILAELKPEKTLTNIWEYAVGLHGTTSDKIAFKHPAVFPEKLAEDHILSWTNEGDVVFDPMCGSGTTCKMAMKNNRPYIGCDMSNEYVELTKKRLKDFNRSAQ